MRLTWFSSLGLALVVRQATLEPWVIGSDFLTPHPPRPADLNGGVIMGACALAAFPPLGNHSLEGDNLNSTSAAFDAIWGVLGEVGQRLHRHLQCHRCPSGR